MFHRMDKKTRLRWACASAQYHKNPRSSQIKIIGVDRDDTPDRNLDLLQCMYSSSHGQASKAKVGLRICAVSQEHPLLAYKDHWC